MAVKITTSDVGRRVSVRSRLADPGGPRHTDTVGYLRDWSEGTLRIERRDGSVVSVEEATLVAGRVVGAPPRRRGNRG